MLVHAPQQFVETLPPHHLPEEVASLVKHLVRRVNHLGRRRPLLGEDPGPAPVLRATRLFAAVRALRLSDARTLLTVRPIAARGGGVRVVFAALACAAAVAFRRPTSKNTGDTPCTFTVSDLGNSCRVREFDDFVAVLRG